MTTVRKWKVVLGLVVGLGVAVGGLFIARQSASSPSQAALDARGFGFTPGHTYEYSLRYDTLHHAAEGIGSEQGLGGALQLEGTYALSVHAAHGGRWLFSAALTGLRVALLRTREDVDDLASLRRAGRR